MVYCKFWEYSYRINVQWNHDFTSRLYTFIHLLAFFWWVSIQNCNVKLTWLMRFLVSYVLFLRAHKKRKIDVLLNFKIKKLNLKTISISFVLVTSNVNITLSRKYAIFLKVNTSKNKNQQENPSNETNNHPLNNPTPVFLWTRNLWKKNDACSATNRVAKNN